MAQIKCPNCERLSSEQTRFCVNCGISFNKKSKKASQESIILRLTLIGVAVFSMIFAFS